MTFLLASRNVSDAGPSRVRSAAAARPARPPWAGRAAGSGRGVASLVRVSKRGRWGLGPGRSRAGRGGTRRRAGGREGLWLREDARASRPDRVGGRARRLRGVESGGGRPRTRAPAPRAPGRPPASSSGRPLPIPWCPSGPGPPPWGPAAAGAATGTRHVARAVRPLVDASPTATPNPRDLGLSPNSRSSPGTPRSDWLAASDPAVPLRQR